MIVKEEIEKEIKCRVGKKRYEHILRVVDMSERLALKHNLDVGKAKKAAFFHDCAKCRNMSDIFKLAEEVGFHIPKELLEFPQIIHAHLGAYLAKNRYNIHDQEILDAIAHHTTACKNMSKIEEVVYLADYLEVERDFPNIKEYRKMAFKDLDKAMYISIENNIRFLLDKKKKIAFDTIDSWNERNCVNK